MRNFLAKIGGKFVILGFKIRAKRLACRMINVVCKTAEVDDVLALVDTEYESYKDKSGMYPDLIRFLYDEVHVEETEE